jgi:hypothetical protein
MPHCALLLFLLLSAAPTRANDGCAKACSLLHQAAKVCASGKGKTSSSGITPSFGVGADCQASCQRDLRTMPKSCVPLARSVNRCIGQRSLSEFVCNPKGKPAFDQGKLMRHCGRQFRSMIKCAMGSTQGPSRAGDALSGFKKSRKRKVRSKRSKPPSCRAIHAAVSDPDPAGLNVRHRPSGKGKVMGQLHYGDIVWPLESSNGWFRIEGYESFSKAGSREHKKPRGWVHGSLLTVVLKNPSAGEIGADKMRLYSGAKPNSSSTKLDLSDLQACYPNAKDKRSSRCIKLKACRQHFLKVQIKTPKGGKHSGWIPSDLHCSNPQTNCN